MMIFKLVFALLVFLGAQHLISAHDECIYEYIGCYKDKNTARAYADLYYNNRGQGWLNFPDFTPVVEKCCHKLLDLRPNNHYMGIQFYGECWTHGKTQSYLNYKRYGKSKKCVSRNMNEVPPTKDKIGKKCANGIYCVYDECGKIPKNRIVNGVTGSYPWMAKLERGGGTLISCQWILTAAHVLPVKIVELGSSTIGKGESYDVVDSKIHPLWKKKYDDYDVAVLKLDRPVNLGPNIWPICLCEEYYEFELDACMEPEGLDIFFLVDESGSMTSDEFQMMKAFVKQTATNITITPDGNHAGLITFDSTANTDINLTEHTNTADFNAAVDNVTQSKGGTRIDKALQLACDEFTVSNGMRPDKEQVVILLTDGEQTELPELIAPAVQCLRNKSVRILVGGIGPDVNVSQLLEIVSDPNDFFHPKNFSELLQMVHWIKVRACKQKLITVAGWGSTDGKGGPYPNNLLKAKVPLFPSTAPPNCHSPRLCSGPAVAAPGDNQGKGTCYGDSGGPYMRKVKGRWYQEAVIMGGQTPQNKCAWHGTIAWGTRICDKKNLVRQFIKDETGI